MKKPALGQFSVSLTVADIEKSLEFYQTLGFEVIDGGHMNEGFPDGEETKWRILRDGTNPENGAVIGLFQGMFDQNIMTFNPKDVRAIQKTLKAGGIKPVSEADASTEGPAHCILIDPDGNQIMFDQH